jgi:hypothetical protein
MPVRTAGSQVLNRPWREAASRRVSAGAYVCHPKLWLRSWLRPFASPPERRLPRRGTGTPRVTRTAFDVLARWRLSRRNWCNGLGADVRSDVSWSPWRLGCSRWRMPVTYPGPRRWGTPDCDVSHKPREAASSDSNSSRCHRSSRASVSTMSHQLAASRGLPQTAPGLAMQAPAASQS